MHTEIKTYALTDDDGRAAHFKIQSMHAIDERMAGRQDSPHRHNYYTIILIHKAQGKHFVDFKSYDLAANTIYFIYPGQVHQVLNHGLSKGWVLTFSQEFLMQHNISEQLINDVYLYSDYGESPPLSLHQHECDALTKIIEQLNEYAQLNSPYQGEALGSLLKLMLIQSNNLCTLSKQNDVLIQETGNVLFRKFKQAINQYFSSKHKVSEYADLLAVSSDYLNKVVKNLTGKSAKDYIQNKIIIEAKRNLLFADLTNKELAYNLGFDEPAHFSNFFKKHSGTSPTDFRALARNN